MLRFRAVNENSAATNIVLSKMSNSMANKLLTVHGDGHVHDMLGLRYAGGADNDAKDAGPLTPGANGFNRCLRHVVPFALRRFGPPSNALLHGLKSSSSHLSDFCQGQVSPPRGQRMALGKTRCRLHPDDSLFMQLRQG